MKIWCNVPFKHTAGNSRFLNNTIRCALTLFTSNDEKRLLDKTLINFNLPRSWLPRILREIVISPAINSSRPSQCFMLSNAKENSLAAGFLVQWIQKTSPQSADYCKTWLKIFRCPKNIGGSWQVIITMNRISTLVRKWPMPALGLTIQTKAMVFLRRICWTI